MTTQIKVLRENVIKALSSIKEDNVSIADVVINRRNLLDTIKLQNQPESDILTLSYGKLSYRDTKYYNNTAIEDYTIDNEPCIQFSCNHTIMRFLNRPKSKNWQEPSIVPLNFVDHRSESARPELTGTPIDTQELIKAITFVLPNVATETSRFVLYCMLFESGDDTLKLIAVDGFRLGIDKVNATGIPADKVLIKLPDVNKLLTFLKSTKTGTGKNAYYPEVYLSYDYKVIKFATESRSIELEKQDGTFPNYGQLIPTDGSKIEFIGGDMLQAVKSVAHIANDGSGIVRLNFKHFKTCGRITVSARSEELGESSSVCDAIVESDCKIAVNNRYLIDLLSRCKEARLTVKVTTESSPMVFEVDNKTVVIMPMFVQW